MRDNFSILCRDDDLAISHVIGRYFQESGYEVMLAEDGKK